MCSALADKESNELTEKILSSFAAEAVTEISKYASGQEGLEASHEVIEDNHLLCIPKSFHWMADLSQSKGVGEELILHSH